MSSLGWCRATGGLCRLCSGWGVLAVAVVGLTGLSLAACGGPPVRVIQPAAPKSAHPEVPAAAPAQLAEEPPAAVTPAAAQLPQAASVAAVEHAVPTGPDVLWKPFFGLPGLGVCKAKLSAIEAKYGKPTQVIDHNGFSIEYRYAAGLIVYTKPGKSKPFVMIVQPPFRAHLPNGLQLGVSTVRQAKALYPDGKWVTADESPYWDYETEPDKDYPRLSLIVERDLGVPEFPMDEERYLDRPIFRFETTVSTDGCDK